MSTDSNPATQADLADLKTNLLDRIERTNNDLLDRIERTNNDLRERIEKTETTLLREFRKWAIS
jgi:hypothetical protein